jgi:hypothetical protein
MLQMKFVKSQTSTPTAPSNHDLHNQKKVPLNPDPRNHIPPTNPSHIKMAQPPDGPTTLPATLNPDALNSAINSLSPALELLERFHHRNKNQHRLSKWWAQADMLRRHVRKMLPELEQAVADAERAARLRLKQQQQQSKKKGKGAKKEDEDALVRARAEYLRWKLGPGAYL